VKTEELRVGGDGGLTGDDFFLHSWAEARDGRRDMRRDTSDVSVS
jgi:hypothetical protein